MQFLQSGENSIDLEGKPPSLGFLVVVVQHIDVSSIKILPFCNRLLNPFGLRYFLSEDLEESRFATTDVTLYRETVVSFGELRVLDHVIDILICVSREHSNYNFKPNSPGFIPFFYKSTLPYITIQNHF